MKPFCECEKVTGVLRDMHATCVQCGGRDAYKKSPERNNKASTANNLTQEQVSEFKEWFNEDDHDLFNYPDEAMQAAWDKASSLKQIKIQELEKQLETANANACFQASLNGKRINKLENQLAESVPKSEIKNLDEMRPIFLHWVNDYVGEDTDTFGNVSYSREDMRYAFQAGYELMQEKAK